MRNMAKMRPQIHAQGPGRDTLQKARLSRKVQAPHYQSGSSNSLQLSNIPGFLTPLLRVVISEAEGCHAPLAFERAELECDQGKSAYPLDQIMLYWRRDNAGIVSETFRTNRFRRKQRQLLIHDPALYPALR